METSPDLGVGYNRVPMNSGTPIVFWRWWRIHSAWLLYHLPTYDLFFSFHPVQRVGTVLALWSVVEVPRVTEYVHAKCLRCVFSLSDLVTVTCQGFRNPWFTQIPKIFFFNESKIVLFLFFLNWIMFYHGYQNKRILYTDISVFSVNTFPYL